MSVVCCPGLQIMINVWGRAESGLLGTGLLGVPQYICSKSGRCQPDHASRRDSCTAMRSQANTAKLPDNIPILMRLRELDVLEKIVGNSKLNVVLGEKGLAGRVVNLL